MPPRGLRQRLALTGGLLVTGPAAFLLSGLIDLAIALWLTLGYLRRSTIRFPWARGRGS